MTKIIMLNGPRQVGKDTLADAFIDVKRPASARKLSIMWPIKLAAGAEWGLTSSQIEALEPHKDEPSELLKDLIGFKTPRQMLIDYATKLREEQGEDVIAKRWRQHAAQLRHYEYIVVPDVRFEVEVEEATKEFGPLNLIVVQVRRADYTWANDVGGYVKAMFWTEFEVKEGDTSGGERLADLLSVRGL